MHSALKVEVVPSHPLQSFPRIYHPQVTSLCMPTSILLHSAVRQIRLGGARDGDEHERVSHISESVTPGTGFFRSHLLAPRIRGNISESSMAVRELAFRNLILDATCVQLATSAVTVRFKLTNQAGRPLPLDRNRPFYRVFAYLLIDSASRVSSSVHRHSYSVEMVGVSVRRQWRTGVSSSAHFHPISCSWTFVQCRNGKNGSRVYLPPLCHPLGYRKETSIYATRRGTDPATSSALIPGGAKWTACHFTYERENFYAGRLRIRLHRDAAPSDPRVEGVPFPVAS
jgi:hypothetical protein